MSSETTRLDEQRAQLYEQMGVTAAQMTSMTLEHAAEEAARPGGHGAQPAAEAATDAH